MNNGLKKCVTRFRAYQLGTPGSSFSYFDGTTFTLIEARLNDISWPSLSKEMEICGKSRVDVLHITSWDEDHCCAAELEEILHHLTPKKIEYPGYEPHTENGEQCFEMILKYKEGSLTEAASIMPTATSTAAVGMALAQVTDIEIQKIDPPYIKSLDPSESYGYRNILYHPKFLYPGESNNNSTIKLFRSGVFNIASLGDVENVNLSASLRRDIIFSKEVDVLILPHHGADNGFMTHSFLKHVRPTLAVCSSDYDNRYEHPRDKIRNMLHEHKIPIFTTKTGDLIIESTGNHTHEYRVTNLIANSSEISSEMKLVSKKYGVLKNNIDSIKNVYNPPKYRSK